MLIFWLVLNTFFKKPNSIFVFVFITILPYTFLSVHYKTTYDLINDIARHSFFIFFIIAGLLFCKFQQVMEILKDKRRLFLKLAFACGYSHDHAVQESASLLEYRHMSWNEVRNSHLKNLHGTYADLIKYS